MNSITIDDRQCVTPEQAAAAVDCSLPTLRRIQKEGIAAPIHAHGRTWVALDDIDKLRQRVRSRVRGSREKSRK